MSFSVGNGGQWCKVDSHTWLDVSDVLVPAVLGLPDPAALQVPPGCTVVTRQIQVSSERLMYTHAPLTCAPVSLADLQKSFHSPTTLFPEAI